MQAEHLPPQNRDAERSVLGSMVRDNAVIDDVVMILPTADLYYFDAHQKIHRAITGLHNAGKPVDIVILAEHLQSRGELEDVGKGAYLAELWDAAPTAANAEYYARIVRDKAHTRHLIHACNTILREAYSSSRPVDDQLADAGERILQIGQACESGTGTIMFGESLAQALAEFDARIVAGKPAGHPTGFVDIDCITGGLHDGEMTVIAARPSVGKTAIAAAIIEHVCCCDRVPTAFFTMEQAHKELSIRMLCAGSGLDTRLFRGHRLEIDEGMRIAETRQQLASAPLYLNDRRMRIGQVVAEARRLWRKHKIGLVVLDYLQYVPADDERDDRRHQIGRQSKALRALARELRVPVVCLAQLNRLSANVKDAKPKLSHINECGEVEQDADVVWLLHRPDKDRSEIEVEIAKNRNGRTDEATLYFRKACTRFENLAADAG